MAVNQISMNHSLGSINLLTELRKSLLTVSSLLKDMLQDTDDHPYGKDHIARYMGREAELLSSFTHVAHLHFHVFIYPEALRTLPLWAFKEASLHRHSR